LDPLAAEALAAEALAAEALAPLCAEAALASDQAIADAAARAAAAEGEKRQGQEFDAKMRALDHLNRALRDIGAMMTQARPEEKGTHARLLAAVLRQFEAVLGSGEHG